MNHFINKVLSKQFGKIFWVVFGRQNFFLRIFVTIRHFIDYPKNFFRVFHEHNTQKLGAPESDSTNVGKHKVEDVELYYLKMLIDCWNVQPSCGPTGLLASDSNLRENMATALH